MAKAQIVMGELGGGGGNIKSGSVALTDGGTVQIDTGLGSGLKRFVIVGQISNAPYTPSFCATWWFADSPTVAGNIYSDSYGGGRVMGLGQWAVSATTVSNGVKVTDVTSGVVTVNAASAYATGTYYWYAE